MFQLGGSRSAKNQSGFKWRDTMKWTGVLPAITTCFRSGSRIDHGFMADHCQWLIENGCTGVVALGSLGEGATLEPDEKTAILNNCTKALKGRAAVVAAISSLTTAESARLAKAAADAGCDGLMVLPPYVYRGDWREMKEHVSAVFQATRLSCMLYNNPLAYGTDFLPEQIQELAGENDNLGAVKESSADVRRISAIRALIGERLALLVGVDDAILEGIGAGAVGWIAGLANALPRESVDLFNHGVAGNASEAFELYRWFLPLLRLDTVPKFVQLIKLVQEDLGVGNADVRPPKLRLAGAELEATRKLIQDSIEARPHRASSQFGDRRQSLGAR
jgi:1-pyrroline-4-hydroxy-2-carboxylate deaminase